MLAHRFHRPAGAVACGLALLLACACACVRAGDAAHGEEPAASASPAAAEAAALEQIRQRLTERLGARPSAAKGSTYDLRVATTLPAPAPMRRKSPPGGAAAAESAVPNPAPPLHWSYDGEGGPEHWAQLQPDFAQCAAGKRQSPIDIRDGIAVQLDPVKFDYRPTGFNVIDNGHTVQVNVGSGNAIEVMGRRYDLVQFHFHRPSEERINGRAYDMVVHLVHKDPEGRLAVVAVLLERGSAHPIVQAVWNNLPLEKEETLAAAAPIDLERLLPEDRRYYTYMGSLTTPPCSEGVLWMVMKQPVAISNEQIAVFSRLYPMNARPVQAASGRLIKESN